MNDKFFSMAGAKQPVNLWLCIALFAAIIFWVVVYYFVQRAEAVNAMYTSNYSAINVK